MSDDRQMKIDKAVGLSRAINLDEFSDYADIPGYLASAVPDCTVSDLRKNIAGVLCKLRAALSMVEAYDETLAAKPGGALLLLAMRDDVEKSVVSDEDCPSGLGWLVKVALNEQDGGNGDAIQRYIGAAAHLQQAYVDDRAYDMEWQHNALSVTFEAYCKLAEEYVKGRAAEFASYDSFIQRVEGAPMPDALQ